MALGKRLLLAASCLALGGAGQLALQAHLANGAKRAELVRPLSDLPMTLANLPTGNLHSDPVSPRAWLGEDQPESATLSAKIAFADQLISRYYRALTSLPSEGGNRGGVAARLYAVYSRKGEDREHHPEICMRDVAGCPEDLSAQSLVYLDKERTRAVQRFRFKTGSEQYTYVYYWHYTLAAAPSEGQSPLQALHQRFGPRPPSVTVQVSTGVGSEDAKTVEESFLVEVDRALQRDVLPPTAQLGCDRLPVRLIMRE